MSQGSLHCKGGYLNGLIVRQHKFTNRRGGRLAYVSWSIGSNRLLSVTSHAFGGFSARGLFASKRCLYMTLSAHRYNNNRLNLRIIMESSVTTIHFFLFRGGRSEVMQITSEHKRARHQIWQSYLFPSPKIVSVSTPATTLVPLEGMMSVTNETLITETVYTYLCFLETGECLLLLTDGLEFFFCSVKLNAVKKKQRRRTP